MSYSSEQTRQRILECAKKEFLEQGYQKANLRKIAEDAKATTGALYNHFKNKEVLFEALVANAQSDGRIYSYSKIRTINARFQQRNRLDVGVYL